MPIGLDETTPLPVPVLVTVSLGRGSVKVAVTVRAWSMVTVHGLVPLQPPPLQPVKTAPPVGSAVSLTEVPVI